MEKFVIDFWILIVNTFYSIKQLMKLYILRVQNLYTIFVLLTKVSSTRIVLDQPGLRSETPIYQKTKKRNKNRE